MKIVEYLVILIPFLAFNATYPAEGGGESSSPRTYFRFPKAHVHFDYAIFEPYLGRVTGKLRWKRPIDGIVDEVEYDVLGYGGGFRFGPKWGYFHLAFDFSYFQLTTTQIANKSNSSGKNIKAGIVMGLTMPMMPIRIWGGYNNVDKYILSEQEKLRGYSYKVGAGITFITAVSLNAEIIVNKYDKWTTSHEVRQLPYSSSEGTYDVPDFYMMLFSLSFPF